MESDIKGELSVHADKTNKSDVDNQTARRPICSGWLKNSITPARRRKTVLWSDFLGRKSFLLSLFSVLFQSENISAFT